MYKYIKIGVFNVQRFNIMYSTPSRDLHPYFTTQEAEQIFGGILRYYAEVYRTQI
jgi:hypothetical protein